MQALFEDEIKRRQILLKHHNKNYSFIGMLKLVILLFICYGAYNAYINKFPLMLLILVFAELLIYVIFHIIHKQILHKIKLEEGLIYIAQKNIKRINGEWVEFEDIGEEFIDNSHPYAADLDIVGKKSVFQMLTGAHTYYGRKKFADDLLYPKYNSDEINDRQEAIQELNNKYSLVSYLEYLFSIIGMDEAFPVLIDELNDKRRFISNRILQLVLKYLWIPTALSIIYTILFRDLRVFYILCILLIIQVLLCLTGFSKAKNYVGIMRKLPSKLFRYESIIKEIKGSSFDSKKLNQIKDIINSSQLPLKELYSISNSVNRNGYGLISFILNILFLRDYRNAIHLDSWKQKYSESLCEWFNALGELESLISFSNLPRACSHTVLPDYSDKKGYINAKLLGHPLINNDVRISNDFSIDNNIYIISGSNMSGKTTFMRTVGINMVLAQAGSYVCAKSMSFSIMNIVTSMRIIDDMNEGISTFYAELKRIKMLIDTAHNYDNTLFLIDEIFRGTNSVDRLKGAEGVLKELSELNISGMITTHDLEVCTLEESNNNIVNYSFSERYENDEMYFDYKLNKGKSRTTNAEYLLKKVGIIK